MLNRWIGILSVAAMLFANAALFTHEILPEWFSGDPPANPNLQLGPDQQRRVQVGIFDKTGRNVGRSWTTAGRAAALTDVTVRTFLDVLALPGGLRTPQALIEISLQYQNSAGVVDELQLDVLGLGIPISLHGESIPPGEFPCRWRIGDEQGTLYLRADATRALGDVIRPFDELPNLYVGRTWRLRLVNPLSQLTPGLTADALAVESVLVRVRGLERIEHDGRSVEAFRVEAPGAVAWVLPEGRVVRQVVQLPILGELTLRAEDFDEDEMNRVAARFDRSTVHRDKPDSVRWGGD
ncbi:hypothetical protein RAS1_16710 [Phycisphaerae bacterium RAS1]|nr:hypothetical protein RAS1_16710 [Phycisphaerae bacterium RAS1]